MVSVTVGAGVLTAQTLCVCLLVCAVFAPSYHREKLIIPGGNSLFFVLSLFSLECTSDCMPFMAKAPFIGRSSKMSSYVRACRGLVDSLNGKSLAEATNFLCGVSISFYGLPQTGCSAFQSIYIASTTLLYFLALSLLSGVLALTLIISFFLLTPTLLTRKGILGMQIGSCLSVTCGGFLYALMGTTLQPQILAGKLFQAHSGDVLHDSFWSFGAGTLVLITAILWSCTMPLWTVWAIKKKRCIDCISTTVDLEEEVTNLIKGVAIHSAKTPYGNPTGRIGPWSSSLPEFRAAAPLYDKKPETLTYGWLSG